MAQVATGPEDLDRAFAICVAGQQKSGRLRKGTLKLTKLGRRVAKRKYAEPEHGEKERRYERLLKLARLARGRD